MDERPENVIVVLDYANGRVHMFRFVGDAEEAYNAWLTEHCLRDNDCSWMTTSFDLLFA